MKTSTNRGNTIEFTPDFERGVSYGLWMARNGYQYATGTIRTENTGNISRTRNRSNRTAKAIGKTNGGANVRSLTANQQKIAGYIAKHPEVKDPGLIAKALGMQTGHVSRFYNSYGSQAHGHA